jgi:carbamoyl-phosphate synthase small subunit
MADGTVFFGTGIGQEGAAIGEICFNTAMTGYQEILTDPSYAGQVITFTFPHIGNVGVNREDIESTQIHARGLVLKAEITNPSNFRAEEHLDRWLKSQDVTGITGVDTRAVTRHIRLEGAQNVAVAYAKGGVLDIPAILAEVKRHPSLKGMELAEGVSCAKPYAWTEAAWQLGKGYGKQGKARFKVAAIDYGVKNNILRRLVSAGCDVTVLPARTKAEDVLALKPDGIFLSNGPGDPAATGKYALPEIKKFIQSGLPVFGICLGHQMLGLALGCKTEKMRQGHRGANHPVKDLETGKVEITSQNHGFVISKDNLPRDVEVTHISLFDQTVQGIRIKGKPVFSVQGHPEASPGPHDTHYLFTRFVEAMERAKKGEGAKATG